MNRYTPTCVDYIYEYTVIYADELNVLLSTCSRIALVALFVNYASCIIIFTTDDEVALVVIIIHHTESKTFFMLHFTRST